MKLLARDNSIVELSPVAYQFGPSGTFRDWDANWLIIEGSVVLADGTAWSFKDPWLTTWEAKQLAGWLRAVASREVPPWGWDPTAEDTDDWGLCGFTEPNLAFSVAAYSANTASLRVHLSLESAQPGSESRLFEDFVVLDILIVELKSALSEWESEIRVFPIR